MKTRHCYLIPLLLIAASACSKPAPGDNASAQAPEVPKIERTMVQARSEVRQKIEKENIRLSSNDPSVTQAVSLQ
ncbi:MAG: hypothetical protein M3Q42_10770 [Pseudomonadota bacterium]|nr:hypothetical protein [Pseudomonadota bacterium]